MRTSKTVAYLCQLEGLIKTSRVNTPQDVSIRTFNSDGTAQTEGGDSISVILEGPDGTSKECEVEDSNDGLYTANFTPESAGYYNLHIKIFGKPIKDSPFQLTVLEDEVEGRGGFAVLEEYPVAMVGHQHEIPVNLSQDASREDEAKLHQLKAEVTTQTGDHVPCKVRGPQNGRFTISYTPTMEGPTSLELFVNDTPLPNSPYTIIVSSVSPRATTVSYDKPIRNQNWPITITPFDYRQSRVSVPEDAIETKVVDLEDQSESSLAPSRLESGAYVVHFVPKHIRYKLNVLLNNVQVIEEVVEVRDYQEFKISGRAHNFPTGIATGSRHIAYVSDTTDGKIHALSTNGSMEYDIHLEAHQTSQIAVDDQGRLVLLFPQSKMVHFLDQQGNELTQWRCHKRNSRPVTMTSTKEGRVVVADSKGPSIFIYRPDGTMITKQTLPLDSIVDGINNICVDGKNRIVVAHHKSPSIHLYDSEGRPLFNFESGATSFQLAVTATVENPGENLLLVSQLGQIRVFNIRDNEHNPIAQIPIANGHIYTNLASTHDGCCLCLDVGQNKIVKYGYCIA